MILMESDRSKGGFGKAIVKGMAQQQANRIKEQIEDSTVDFRLEAGAKIEGLAEQIRLLGKRFENRGEAHLVARRLERVADYLRFRPAPEIGSDLSSAAKRYHLLWVAGGMLGTVLLYRVLRRYHR